MLTLARRSEAALKVRGSKFLAFAIPVESEEEARREIEAFEVHYPDATHHCFAWRIERGGSGVERSSDAGEPAGSAGAPILSVIKGRELDNLLVVVVRYFGGTKLGVGGLVRAYRDAARLAIESGEVVRRTPRRRLGVNVPLSLAGEARSQAARLEGEVLSETYADTADLLISVGEDKMEDLRKRIDDLTRGAARWREE